MRRGWLILTCLVLFLKNVDAQVVSDFSADADGWTASDINGSSAQTVIYSGTGGNPGGFISMTTANPNAMYWTAPSKFLGNRAYTSYGENLTFDVKTAAAPANIDHGPSGDIMIASTGFSIWANLQTLPTASNTWTSLSIKLDETAGNWKAYGITGATATRDQIMAVLTNITNIKIYIQWKGTVPGANVLGSLDNVTLNFRAPLPPAPSITSFNPTKATPGTNITITGTNFGSSAANNAVYFGGLKANIVSANATSITATLPVGADYAPPMVVNLTSNLSGVARKNFIPMQTNGGARILKGSFASDVLFNRTVGFIAHGDINGDGKPEMLASQGNQISIFQNVSTPGTITSSSFATRVDMNPSLPDSYAEIGMDDLDGDGKKDIFVAFRDNPDQGRIGVLRNIHTTGLISAASFATFQEFSVPPYTTFSAMSADFDGDGRPEMVSWGSSCGPNPVYVLQNVSLPGDIRFTAALSLSGANSCGSRFSAADIDGDGKLDLVQSTGGTLRIFRNTSTVGVLSFDTGTDLSDGGAMCSIGDLDNDGKPDIVYASGGMKIYKNVSTPGSITIASFQGPITFAGGIAGARISDINGDGKPDVVVGTNQGFGVYENVAIDGQINTLSFRPIVAAEANNNVTDVDVFDVDGDGRPDLVGNNAGTGTISVTQNVAHFPPTITNISPKAASPGATVTITGTNFSTLASDHTVYFGSAMATVSNATTTSLEVVVPVGATYDQVSVALKGFTIYSQQFFTPTFSGGSTFSASSYATSLNITTSTNLGVVSAMDYDGDGKVDILADNNSTTSILRNTGNTGVIDASTFAPLYTVTQGLSLKPGDYDGDGKPDLNTSSYMLRNISNAALPNPIAFETYITRDNGGAVRLASPRDLNNDGKIDAIYTGGNVNIYYSENLTRTGSFTAAGDVLASFSSFSSQPKGAANGYCVAADFDGDGFNDIASTSPTTNNFTAYLNAGLTGTLSNASFNSGKDFATNNNPNGIVAFDFDGDGKTDLAVANTINNVTASISVFRNISTAGNIDFARQDFAASTGPTDIVAADLDGDGKPDLVVTNVNAQTFSIFKNTSTPGILNTSSFAAKVDYALGSQPRGLAVADIDRDLRPDIIVTKLNNDVAIFRSLVQLGPIISFSQQPVSKTVCENSITTFSVVASGANNLTYQWQVFNTGTSVFDNISNNSTYSNATTATLTVSNITASMNGTIYRCMVNGDAASAKASDQATLTVSTSPAAPITTGGTSCKGASVTLSAGGSTDGNYRWFDSPTSPQPINGEVNGTYKTPVIFTTTTFYAGIANANGCVSARTAAVATIAPLVKPGINANGTLLCGVNTVAITGPAGFPQYHWSNGESTQNINVSFTGSYSLIVEDANGCQSLASDAIVVTAGSVTKPVIDGNKTRLCAAGDQVLLTAPAGFTGYEWSNGATTQSVTITAAGSYNVRVTNASGCRSETSDDFVIDLGAEKPVISAGANVLVSTPAKTYQWYYGDAKIPEGTKQFLSYNPFQYGAYTVAVTDFSDCASTSDVFVNLVTATEEAGENEMVYPNPFTDVLIMHKQGSLLDATGRQVKKLVEGENDVSQLPQGLYLVMIKENSQLKLIKVTK